MENNFSATLLESVRVLPQGGALEVGVRLPWYRALPLSVVEVNNLRIDGQPVPPERVQFALNGKKHSLSKLPELVGESWFVLDAAVLHVDAPGLRADADHEVTMTLNLYPPYIPGLNWVTEGRRAIRAGHEAAPAGRGLKLGSTLFSFTNEFLAREYSLEQLIAQVAQMGLGPGLEVVGFQSVRGFPVVSDEFASRFRDLLQQHGLVATCLAINADMGIRRGQLMDVDAAVAYYEPQIRAAAKLGFRVVRGQFGPPPEVLRRILPLLESLNLKFGPELHTPMTVHSPMVSEYREVYDKLGSPCLGFVPDFGSCTRRFPPGFVKWLQSQGTPQAALDLAYRVWDMEGDAFSRKAEFMRQAAAARMEPSVAGAVGVMFSMFTNQPASVWAEIMPQIIHVHGKFYEFDESGGETSIPYEELLPVFVRNGYDGYMSSEWEGTIYSKASGFDMVRRHHALCRRILAGIPSSALQ
jgi:sugar phosphate isomerase/epimerase